jgi:ParB-like nuclease domain
MIDQRLTTFDRARRKRAYRRLARVVSGNRPTRELLPLEETTTRLRPFSRTYVGLRVIPVRQIVGTEGRTSDFDRDFLPIRSTIKQRWRQVERGFPDGDFPPIVVYQIGDAYFVIDGHHRVAIARQRGVETIDAEVTELCARWHLPVEADLLELIHAEQERIFMDESGLGAVHPNLRIRFTRPVGYIELLENVQLHGYHLMLANGRVLEPSEIAADWYDRVYLPALEAIERERLADAYPETTEADRFLCVSQRRRELLPEWGRDALDEAYRRVRDDAHGSLRRSVLRRFAA